MSPVISVFRPAVSHPAGSTLSHCRTSVNYEYLILTCKGNDEIEMDGGGGRRDRGKCPQSKPQRETMHPVAIEASVGHERGPLQCFFPNEGNVLDLEH